MLHIFLLNATIYNLFRFLYSIESFINYINIQDAMNSGHSKNVWSLGVRNNDFYCMMYSEYKRRCLLQWLLRGD